MKPVFFDVSALATPFLSGVGTYAQNVLLELKKLEASQNEWTLTPVLKLSRWKKNTYVRRHISTDPAIFWPVLQSRKDQIFHGPDFQIPSGVRGAKVVTIHDLAFYEPGMTSPDFARMKIQQIEHLILKQKPDAVLTVSHYSKQTLIERFPQLKDRVLVTHLGHEHLISPSTTSVQPLSAPKPYFLFVGNLEARKNVGRLLQAFEAYCAHQKDDETELILIGRGGYGFADIQKTHHSMRNPSKVKFLGHVTHQELKSYYQGALAFLYPSIIEGFGLPLVEAMLEGCPILTSDRTSTKEVAGDAALFVNPFEIESIEEGLTQLATQPNLRTRLAELGRKRVVHFSWSRCASQTLDAYKRFF